MKSNSLFIAGAFLAGGALGAVAGFRLAEKRLTEQFNTQVDVEREAARALYNAPVKNQVFSTPQEAVEELILVEEALKTYRGEQEPKEPIAYHKIRPSTVEFEKAAEVVKPDPVQEQNIFAINEEPGEIEVISLAEFESGETGFDQPTLNYYVEDDVLATIEDEKIEDREGTIGDALDHFGWKSDDPNVVHVRNNKIQLEFEICRVEGSWAMEAHGMTPAGDRPSQSGG